MNYELWHRWAEQTTTWGPHAERTVNAHGGMTGTMPEQSCLVQSSAITTDTGWHDRQYRKQRANLNTNAESTTCRRSDRTWRTAVSVEWPGRKPDWRNSRRMEDCRRYWAAVRQSAQVALTPPKDYRLDWAFVTSSPGFLIAGVMKASLNVDGKWPADMERLKNSVRNVAISSATSFITETGSFTGSAAELLSDRPGALI